jgi:hypothetical protein
MIPLLKKTGIQISIIRKFGFVQFFQHIKLSQDAYMISTGENQIEGLSGAFYLG